jgi:hypothetical protein
MRTRFQVCDSDSLRETAGTRADAFRIACDIAERDQIPVTVHDRMAHLGCPQEWVIHPGTGFKNFLWLPPTKTRTA